MPRALVNKAGKVLVVVRERRGDGDVSCLELFGTPSHLRYLLRRLRQRLPPDVPVLVGLWPQGEAILPDERLRAAVGADYYTSSLREAVEACLEVAHKAGADEKPPRVTAAAGD